jgi:hypothetical protein
MYEETHNPNTTNITVTSDCICEVYDEELEQYTPATECFGDCYSEMVENLNEVIIKPYAEAKGWQLDDQIKVEVSAIGWQRRSGYTMTTLDGLLESLQINGDFRIVFTRNLDTNELTAVRYSHDEPVGTGTFEITEHYLSCDKCGDPVKDDVHAEELGMCVECSNRYFNHEDEE